jgi:hypothetical protein
MTFEPCIFFDEQNHLQSLFNKIEFDTLHGWDFGWAILELINIAESRDEDAELSKRFSPGQKALYFFWYLDGAVTNGGFIQFYWNGYREYLPTIINGLKLIGDTELLELIGKADKEYLKNENVFALQHSKSDWSPLYRELKNFETFDETYYDIHDNTMSLIERYARKHPGDFVRFE